MTTLAITLPVRPLAGRSLRDDLAQLWHNEVARHRHRRLLRQLSRRDPRLVADMGFDPEEVQAAAEGTWDELHPERVRIFSQF